MLLSTKSEVVAGKAEPVSFAALGQLNGRTLATTQELSTATSFLAASSSVWRQGGSPYSCSPFPLWSLLPLRTPPLPTGSRGASSLLTILLCHRTGIPTDLEFPWSSLFGSAADRRRRRLGRASSGPVLRTHVASFLRRRPVDPSRSGDPRLSLSGATTVGGGDPRSRSGSTPTPTTPRFPLRQWSTSTGMPTATALSATVGGEVGFDEPREHPSAIAAALRGLITCLRKHETPIDN